MKIIHIASEISPSAKVGGLADVLQGLAREQTWKGRDSRVVLPHYGCIDKNQLSKVEHKSSFGIWWGGTWWGGGCEERRQGSDIKLCLIDSNHPNNYFHRSSIYGFSDDSERFAHFCRASLDWMVATGLKPDILHLHDWQASLCALLAREYPFEEHFRNTKIVLTIHNLEYQGYISRHALELAGCDGRHVDPHSHHGNMLASAIAIVDKVVAVSPTYAKEILTSEGGKGLDQLLKSRKSAVSGILNGLDYTYWNPATDTHLVTQYSIKDFQKKQVNKEALLQRLGMVTSHRPLIACVTRLVPQKGIDLIKHALHEAFRLKYQMVLIGSTHDPKTTSEFLALQDHYSQDPNVRLALSHDEDLAHLLFASSDMMIVPSIFEPCGLTQLIALRYGSIPIVRKTGGLSDTVIDVQNKNGNGFVFESATPDGFSWALQRAVLMWNKDPEGWEALVRHGMGLDFSWNRSESKYYELYSEK